MASYFTRAKVRSDDTQPGDSASVAATTPALTSSSVERNVELAGGSESMSIEVAGPMTTHPQQFPLESEEANVTDVSAMAESVTKLPKGTTEQASLRQPPTVSDTTAAAFPRSTTLAEWLARLTAV